MKYRLKWRTKENEKEQASDWQFGMWCFDNEDQAEAAAKQMAHKYNIECHVESDNG